MKAATGVKQNVDHGCVEIDTLLQVATPGFLTDAVRPVEKLWPRVSMMNDIGRRSRQNGTDCPAASEKFAIDCELARVSASYGSLSPVIREAISAMFTSLSDPSIVPLCALRDRVAQEPNRPLHPFRSGVTNCFWSRKRRFRTHQFHW